MFDYEMLEIAEVITDDPDQRYKIKIVRAIETGDHPPQTKWLTIGTAELAEIRAIFARRES